MEVGISMFVSTVSSISEVDMVCNIIVIIANIEYNDHLNIIHYSSQCI